VLQFVPTSEGYYDVVKNKYIYNYTDHLGNVRLSYTKGASGGAEIIEENNYYPFGLKHQGYNSSSLANNAYQYKYQGQELQENGWYSFKWRNYIPDLGKFFNIDPLASKYPYNSPYALQENKLGMGVELEGLELFPFEFLLMSNSSVRPTIAETMIKETPIEGVTVYGRVTPPPRLSFFERIGNAINKGWDYITGNTKPEVSQSIENTIEQVKPENLSENIKPENAGKYAPERDLPRVPKGESGEGEPLPDAEALAQLGTKQGRKGNYTQAREFDKNGKPVRDIDFTDHGRPQNHANPHQHRWEPNQTGGTLQRSKKSTPLNINP
ncbi:RHS repeat-associated core domain-containing protein, partial [Elizabethkingia anophelis]|uniref:RHS repeat domain-containing protein n=5 Tax=Elizabethkingia TaxID=308865 RepID=UPI003450DB82